MKRLGKYELIEQIGHGAMGVVYKALDTTMERIVAVKTISADLDADPELRTRFFREARSAGQLSHKNIVTIYGLDEEGGTAYMVMEFLDGEDVKGRIARGERIPLERRLRYMIEVTEGLAHAHKKGVFHRDIKPGNIYITNTGQVKILDFGLARMATSDMTKAGSVMGTPDYMSPEQIRGNPVDSRSDIFSAGATFYELLSYRKPFYSESLQSTFFKILQEDPEPIENIDSSIPPEFSAVLLRAMAKKPAERYQSADEMAQALRRLERTLEQHKRKAKEEVQKAVTALDRLVSENASILGSEQLQSELQELRSRSLVSVGAEHDEEGTLKPNPELGFLEILEIRDRARREYERLDLLLQKQQAAVSLLQEVAALESNGQLDKALELTEKIVADLPEHGEALASSRRIRKMIADRSEEEARDAVEKLQLLIAENEDLLEGESHFNPSDLKAAILLVSISAQSVNKDAKFSAPSSQGNNVEVLEIRDKARNEHERLQGVISTRRKIRQRVAEATTYEEAGKLEEALRLAQEILREVPTQREVHALLARVREILSRRAREEARKRQLARLLDQSLQLRNQKKLPDSLRNLEEALNLDPENPVALALHRQISTEIEAEERRQEQTLRAADLFQTASTQFSGGDLVSARNSLLEALALDPNTVGAADFLAEVERRIQEQAKLEEKKRKVEAAVISARKSFDAGDLKRARQEAQLALSIDPEGGAARETLEKIVQAEEELRSLQERQRRLQSLFEGALSLFEAENDVAAAAKVTALLELDPHHVAGLELNTRIVERREARERAARKKRDRIATALTQARESFASGDLERALELAGSVLKEEPAHPEAGDLLVRIEERKAYKNRQELERRRVEREARERAESEKRERITKNLGEARKARVSGELEKARGLALSLLSEDPTHSEAGDLLREIERAIETRRQREEAEKEGHDLLSQAETLAHRGNYQEAVSILDGANPLVASLPSIKQGIEEYRKAARVQEEVRERTRRVLDHMDRGKRAFERGDFAACAREMDQILALEPGNAGASNILAQARTQLQKQHDEELRLKEISDSVRAAEQALKAGQLDEARRYVQRVMALDSNSGDAARLEAAIGRRETALREEQARMQRGQALLAEARSELEKGTPYRAGSMLAEAMSLGVGGSDAAALLKRIEKEKRRLTRARRPKPRIPRAAIWIGLLVAIGLLVWALRSNGRQYGQQMTSAKLYLEEKQFDKAMETLQHIPSSSPLYTQAQDLMAQARNGQKQRDIDAFLAEAGRLRSQGQNDESLLAVKKVLELDASNQMAISLRNEIERERYQSKSEAERDQYVNATLTSAQELFNDGNLEAAKRKADEVVLVRPGDPQAADLRRRIDIQIEAAGRAGAERSKLEQAKAGAERAKAPELAQARFAAAQSAEETALIQQKAKQLDNSAKKFSEAAQLYAEAEREARAESQARAEREGQRAAAIQLQRTQAETARGVYEQSRTRARDAEADTKASDRFQAAVRMASEAQGKLDRGDFAGARSDFDAASAAMQLTADGAAKATQTAQQTAQGEADRARTAMEAAKRDLAGGDARAAAEETRGRQLTQEGKLAEAGAAYQNAASLYRDAAQRSESARREENERQAIRSALDLYRAAYEKRDLAALRAVFPNLGGMEEVSAANNFKLANSIQLELVVKDIQISGETARVTTQYRVNAVMTDRSRQSSPQTSVIFNMGKGNNGSWVIQSVIRSAGR